MGLVAIHALADFGRTQVIQAEGYNTVDLLKDIENRLDAVNTAAQQIDYSQRVLNHAEEIHKQPHRGELRQWSLDAGE